MPFMSLSHNITRSLQLASHFLLETLSCRFVSSSHFQWLQALSANTHALSYNVVFVLPFNSEHISSQSERLRLRPNVTNALL